MNALTFTDKILECLSRDGPELGVTHALIPLKDIPALKPGLSFLGMHCVSPRFSPKLQKWNLGSRVIPHALKLSRAYYEVILDSYPKFLSFSLNEQLEALKSMASWNLEDFVKNAKFFTVYPLARFLKNPLPVRPASFPEAMHISLFTGRLKRFFKSRIVAFNRKNLGFYQGLLQGVKRGAEIVPDDFVRDAMVKHRTILSKPELDHDVNPTDWAEKSDFMDFQPYYQRFFKKFKPVTPTLLEASTSAGFSSKRGEGGARAFLRKVHNYSGNIDTEENDLLEMYESRPGVVKTTRGQATWSNFGSLMSDIHLMSLDSDLNDQYMHKKVSVSAVCEPLKVRLITKGNEFSYYASRFYQKALWRYLQKYPQFVATSRPIQTSDFYSLLEREENLFKKTPTRKSAGVPFKGLYNQSLIEVKPFDQWVSGDYSAATDSIKINHTKEAFEASLSKSRLGDDVIGLLRSVIYEQEISYPKRFSEKGGLDPIMQTNGQLMGSTLSFPILCTINLIAYWAALEEYFGRQISIHELPVMINGDDILFRTNDEFYALWLRKVASVGFELSLGKNYVHKTFFTINSKGFLFDRGAKTFSEVSYLNVGLLTGQSKLGKRKKDLLPINSIYNEVMEGAHDKYRAHQRFMHYNKKDVDTCTKAGQFSLFVSPFLGGCGFKLHPEVRPHVYFTNFQTKLASYIYQEVLLKTHQSDYEPFKALSYRIPALQDSIKNINVKRKLYHHGFYRFIPLTQPNNENQLDIPLENSSPYLNVGSIDSESHPLEIKSFPIKTLLSFREELKNPKSKIRYHTRMNNLFLDLQVKIVEEKVVDTIQFKVPEGLIMDEYLE
jgi:hypothetical protein